MLPFHLSMLSLHATLYLHTYAFTYFFSEHFIPYIDTFIHSKCTNFKFLLSIIPSPLSPALHTTSHTTAFRQNTVFAQLTQRNCYFIVKLSAQLRKRTLEKQGSQNGRCAKHTTSRSSRDNKLNNNYCAPLQTDAVEKRRASPNELTAYKQNLRQRHT